jgi:putative lipoprotein
MNLRPEATFVALFCLLLASLAGCASSAGQQPVPSAAAGVVTGKVFYLQKIALPPDTKMTVELLDVTNSGRTKVISTDSQTIGAKTPADFRLAFSPSAIRADRVYQVRARLDAGGRVWTHEQQYPVLTGGAPAYVEIRVSPARAD